ncbi:uncharacterized protein LOC131627320 [Vicia villosa]|uniref:uncharacterized protein LOC131627320 n=1 Tax=Vicia villosa TaxID=3911 RepID=UPI00273AE546|nr:uncharacterized protein LOC131627320 [Vicia villosa]
MSELYDFRPICLVGCMYKALSKLLAARLKKVLDSIVSKSQSVFVPSRQLMDGVLVVNEVVDYAAKTKKGIFLFKVNFENAYNTVTWNNLRNMLKRTRFGDLWLNWMEAMVFTTWTSVLVNESPTFDFEVEKGLRQGDLLSPFLFALVAYGLSGLVRKASEIGEFSRFKVEESCIADILQYVDDTLLIGEGNWRHVWSLKAILRGFEMASGLRVNFHKSRLIRINISIHMFMAASNFLSCRIEEKAFSFIGIPIGSNPRRISTGNRYCPS